jgi:hypothetical protein
MRKFSQRSVPNVPSRPEIVSRIEASIELFMILQESQMNDFEDIATGGEF